MAGDSSVCLATVEKTISIMKNLSLEEERIGCTNIYACKRKMSATDDYNNEYLFEEDESCSDRKTMMSAEAEATLSNQFRHLMLRRPDRDWRQRFFPRRKRVRRTTVAVTIPPVS
ncbi:hypothetical protein ABFX02_14G232600 [Erythranthe guttata]